MHYQQDVEGLDMELRYFRDVDGREVDFVLTLNRQPMTLNEWDYRSPDDIRACPAVEYLRTLV